MQRLTAAQRRKEFEEMDAALSPARDLIEQAVTGMIARARRAKSLPDVPDVVIGSLNDAIAIMAAASGLGRSACVKTIQSEFEIRLVLKFE
jgi:hypothetical protein